MKQTNKAEELLLDVLIQAVGYIGLDHIRMVDNECLSSYAGACNYLEKKGYLKRKNNKRYLSKIYWVAKSEINREVGKK